MTAKSKQTREAFLYLWPLVPKDEREFVLQETSKYVQNKMLSNPARILGTAAMVGTFNVILDTLVFKHRLSPVRLMLKFLAGIAVSLCAQYISACEEGIVDTVEKSLDFYESTLRAQTDENNKPQG